MRTHDFVEEPPSSSPIKTSVASHWLLLICPFHFQFHSSLCPIHFFCVFSCAANSSCTIQLLSGQQVLQASVDYLLFLNAYLMYKTGTKMHPLACKGAASTRFSFRLRLHGDVFARNRFQIIAFPRPVYTKTLETLPFSCENEMLKVFFPGNVLGSSSCKHSKTTIWMKTQNGRLVVFAHSGYCLTIHQLLVLFIDRNVLEDQDICPLEGIKTCGDYNSIDNVGNC